ncbi:hypothetical protein DID75_03090 [Candidatus Marinamargulisbacteria bacterium SCGC AG-410-N11]|nr:hypothetical protein DID75_03090 [Candidatus Marinamargulisbacteria bacterium SCGC AG-410-N11]
MKYSNIVKFKTKEGQFDNVMNLLSEPMNVNGLNQHIIVKTGENLLCAIGIWESEDHIVNARPEMIKRLDSIRDMLDTLSEELGVTDPVSGPILHEH